MMFAAADWHVATDVNVPLSRWVNAEFVALVNTGAHEDRAAGFQANGQAAHVAADRTGVVDQGGEVPGYTVPLHRALSEPILLGGAPRAIAIMNGTLAGAVGLGLRLWLVGLGLWAIGHFAAVWAAKRDPQFVDVVRRHLRIPGHLSA